jgi:hypothetical protein
MCSSGCLPPSPLITTQHAHVEQSTILMQRELAHRSRMVFVQLSRTSPPPHRRAATQDPERANPEGVMRSVTRPWPAMVEVDRDIVIEPSPDGVRSR